MLAERAHDETVLALGEERLCVRWGRAGEIVGARDGAFQPASKLGR